MFCKNCGMQMPDDAVFCPECGNRKAMLIEDTVQPDTKNVLTEKTKKSKKTAGIIAGVFASVAAIVAVVAVIFVFAGPKYTKENVFASATRGVDRDSDQYHILNAFASAHNLLFNSENFEFEISADGESVGGKISFGKDLASSELIIESEDLEFYAAFENGVFEGIRYEIGYEIDIISLIADIPVSISEKYGNADENYAESKKSIEEMINEEGSEISEKEIDRLFLIIDADYEQSKQIVENADKIEKCAQNIVTDNHLSYDSFFGIFDNFFAKLMERNLHCQPDMQSIKIPTYDVLLPAFADFIKNGIDENDIDIDVTKNGKGKDAVTVYKISFEPVDIAEALLKYVSERKNLIEILGEDAELLLDDLDDAVDSMKGSSDGEKINLSIEMSSGYMTKLKTEIYNDSVTFRFMNVNSTEVQASDYSGVRKEIDKAEDFIVADNWEKLLYSRR